MQEDAQCGGVKVSEGVLTCYRRWFEYEKDSHAKVVKSLESVPADRRSSPEYKRALSILGHIAAARRIWLGRLGAAPLFKGPIFPESLDLAQLTVELDEVHQLWAAFLGRLTDVDIAKTFEYQSLDAGRFRNTIEDVLTQLHGHSLYHRGQISMLVRQAGGEPATTDFIYWCRELLV